MRIRDIIIAASVTLLILVGGKVMLDRYSQNDDARDNVNTISTEITKYTAEHAPYIDTEKERGSIKSEYIFKIRDVVYKGKLDDVFYLHSIDEICANYVCDDGTSFDIDLSKDKVIAMYFICKKDENKKGVTDAEKEEIATEYAKELIDIEEYKMEVDKSGSTNGYSFTRYIDDFKTCEEVRVFVKDTGDISSFWAMEIGEFKNVYLEGAEEKKSEEALASKIKELYGEKTDYDINENFLLKTRDGKLAMIYSINLTKEDGVEEREFFKVIWE